MAATSLTDTATPPGPATAHNAIEPGIDLDWLAQRIDYRRFQECIHCGLCTASCPTYVITGNENDSPRGRIYLMRAVTDGRLPVSERVRKHLNLCLDCRACESACPSGVKYGQIIEPFKIALLKRPSQADRQGPLTRFILHQLFPSAGRTKAALMPVKLMQKMGLWNALQRSGMTRWLPGMLQRMQAMVPELQGRGEDLPELLPAIGPRRARVGLLTGCVAEAMFPKTNLATARVLQHNGCEVVIPRAQVCCGAVHYHSGAEEAAIALARINLRVFEEANCDAIIVNAAGCGAMLKDYAHLLPAEEHDAAVRMVAKVKDIAEFLIALGPVPPTRSIPGKVTYHDACHLCHGQQIRSQPRALLQMIPGLELVPLDESELCCGAAGTYNLTQPEMSATLGQRKAEKIEQTGAPTVVTGNVGCILQISRQLKERGSAIEVAHPIDLLARAYDAGD